MTMTCDEARLIFSEVTGTNASLREISLMREHVSTCSDCRLQATTFIMQDRLLTELAAESSAARIQAMIHHRLQGTEEKPAVLRAASNVFREGIQGDPRRRRRQAPHWVMLAIAAGVIIALFLRYDPLGMKLGIGPVTLASITSGEGDVRRGTKLIRATPGMNLYANDRIFTDAAANLSFQYRDGSTVDLHAGSVCALQEQTNGEHLLVESGDIYVAAVEQSPSSPLVIHTGYADAAVVGTAFEVSVTPELTRLRVASGVVQFENDFNTVSVNAAMECQALAGKHISEPTAMNELTIAAWRQQQQSLIGLLAHWKFDESTGESAMDSSGNGHNGRLIGDIQRSSSGKIGGAIVLDGLNDYVEVLDHPSLRLQAFTLSAWVRWLDGSGFVLGKPFRSKMPGPWGSYRICVTANGMVNFSVQDSVSDGYPTWLTTAPIAADTWTLVTTTYQKNNFDETDGVVFVNGVAADTTFTANGLGYSPDFAIEYDNMSLNIGRSLVGSIPSDYFHGLIDDVRIFERALTAAEIAALARITQE